MSWYLTFWCWNLAAVQLFKGLTARPLSWPFGYLKGPLCVHFSWRSKRLTDTLYQISSYSSFVIWNRQNVITSVTQLWNSSMVFSNSMWLKVFIACKLWSFFENSSSLSPHTEVMYFDVRAIAPGQQKKCHKKTTTIHFLILFVKELRNNTKIKNVWSYTSNLQYVKGCVA